ncbi:hypothetical protein Tsubulata_025817 [Turnera subulata]|uniref:Non-structural maintenance of chromosomes element 4 n=1 Tax=Turnera subulata TaxID=218843 RepID=A0A9Q0F935_9ROSI|nr:hypothetical protein Tsubulata_025817 [Turnera subulata]
MQTRRVKREQSTRSRVNAESNESSDQNPDERRVIRNKYYEIRTRIKNTRDELIKAGSEKFDSLIKEVEDLHLLVQKPREQVADAEALLGLANTLVSSVRSHSNEGITAAEFVSSLVKNFGQSGRSLDREDDDNAPVVMKWRDIGLAVSPIFMKCSGFTTMLGPMSTELKQRKVSVVSRKRTRPTEKDKPQEIEDSRAEEKTDTDKNMETMFNILRKKKQENLPVRLENLIFNRRSFAQTVENLFALSFLVKDGRVRITVDGSGSQIVSPTNAPAANAIMSKEVAYKHFVFRFDFKDWKLMMKAVPDGEELMPDRDSLAASQVDPAADGNEATVNRTPIRKLSRNRGLVVQEDSVVAETPESEDIDIKPTGVRRCKRRLV